MRQRISTEFIGNTIIAEDCCEVLAVLADTEIEEYVYPIVGEVFENFRKCAGKIAMAMGALGQRDYMKARECLGIGDDYCMFASDISSLRMDIKSLLAGIIKTSSITMEHEMADCLRTWERFDQSDKYSTQFMNQRMMIRKFKRVSALGDLPGFNDFFHNFLVILVCTLSELLIRKMNYTIRFFKSDKALEPVLMSAVIQVKEFRNAMMHQTEVCF